MTQNSAADMNVLVELFWQRDERALDYTQREYGEYCFAVAHRILGNISDSEECVNDAYLHVWNSIPPARPNNFKAFIAKITRNLAIDKLKHRSAEKRNATLVAFEELEEVLFSNDSHISDDIALSQLQQAINDFLYTQTSRDRAIFILRYFYCEQVSVIANKMGTSESNTSKILTNIRKKLRVYLKKEGYYV